VAVAALVAEPPSRLVWRCQPGPMVGRRLGCGEIGSCGRTWRMWQNFMTCGNAGSAGVAEPCATPADRYRWPVNGEQSPGESTGHGGALSCWLGRSEVLPQVPQLPHGRRVGAVGQASRTNRGTHGSSTGRRSRWGCLVWSRWDCPRSPAPKGVRQRLKCALLLRTLNQCGIYRSPSCQD
jgi:hypothetical protein